MQNANSVSILVNAESGRCEVASDGLQWAGASNSELISGLSLWFAERLHVIDVNLARVNENFTWRGMR